MDTSKKHFRVLRYTNHIPMKRSRVGDLILPFLVFKTPFFWFRFDIGFPDTVWSIYPNCICNKWINTDSWTFGKIYDISSRLKSRLKLANIIYFAKCLTQLINACRKSLQWLTEPIEFGINSHKTFLISQFHLTWNGAPFPESNLISDFPRSLEQPKNWDPLFETFNRGVPYGRWRF